MRLLCHALPCRKPVHLVGSFETAFCTEHFETLTPLKQAEVLEIQHFSVLDPRSRMRAVAIINECRRYLLARQHHRKTA